MNRSLIFLLSIILLYLNIEKNYKDTYWQLKEKLYDRYYFKFSVSLVILLQVNWKTVNKIRD